MADTDIMGFSFLNMFEQRSTRPGPADDHNGKARDNIHEKIIFDGKHDDGPRAHTIAQNAIVFMAIKHEISLRRRRDVMVLFSGPPRTTHWSREPADARRYNYATTRDVPLPTQWHSFGASGTRRSIGRRQQE